METQHFAIHERKIEELEEISERTGRQKTDLFREALDDYLNNRKTDKKIHAEAPAESIVRENDEVMNLEFNEMWNENGEHPESPEKGDIVRAMEDNGKYCTYYKFLFMGERYVCKIVAPIKYEVLQELHSRGERYTI